MGPARSNLALSYATPAALGPRSRLSPSSTRLRPSNSMHSHLRATSRTFETPKRPVPANCRKKKGCRGARITESRAGYFSRTEARSKDFRHDGKCPHRQSSPRHLSRPPQRPGFDEEFPSRAPALYFRRANGSGAVRAAVSDNSLRRSDRRRTPILRSDSFRDRIGHRILSRDRGSNRRRFVDGDQPRLYSVPKRHAGTDTGSRVRRAGRKRRFRIR